MGLPGVAVSFLNGQLGASTAPNDDSVFVAIGACSNGLPDAVKQAWQVIKGE